MSLKINWPDLFKEVFEKKNFIAVAAIGFFPPIIGAINVIAGLEPKPSADYGLFHFLMGWVYSYIVTASLYFGSAIIIRGLNKILPWKGNITKRLSLEVPLILVYVVLTQTFLLWSLEGSPFLFIQGKLALKDYVENIFFSSAITMIVVTMVEGVYFFRNWRESAVAAERLQKENANSQLANLRAQLDPHFMFNSLNVLTGLIRQDPRKAESFVEDFARVYRHMLEVSDHMMVPIEEEVRFTRQYLRLQQTRFGDGLQLEWHLSESAQSGFIPPLSLQELISNAIKHNAIHPDQPLVLRIESDDEVLRVRNNLQPREGQAESTGLGLENIRARYEILSKRKPEFKIEGQEFVAQLPIMHLEE